MCETRHTQITQNSKFAISLQYHNKELSNEVAFSQADKHERWAWASIPKVPELVSLQYL